MANTLYNKSLISINDLSLAELNLILSRAKQLKEKPQLDLLNHKLDRKSTRLNSSHIQKSRMPSSA